MKVSLRIVLFVTTIVSVLCSAIASAKKNCTRQQVDTRIPKVIWTYWHDPSTMPPLVSRCIDSWKTHNPSYAVNIVTRDTVRRYLPNFNVNKTLQKMHGSPAHVADRIRLALLSEYGGIWMDASLLCTASLDWVHATKAEVVMYSLKGFTTRPDIPVVETWFIAAAPSTRFVCLWRDEVERLDTFASPAAYVQDVKNRGTDLQNILWPAYLAISVSAQVVLQRDPALVKSMRILPGEDGPYKYLAENGWDQETAFDALCSRPIYTSPDIKLVKFRSSERAYLSIHHDRETHVCTTCLHR